MFNHTNVRRLSHKNSVKILLQFSRSLMSPTRYKSNAIFLLFRARCTWVNIWPIGPVVHLVNSDTFDQFILHRNSQWKCHSTLHAYHVRYHSHKKSMLCLLLFLVIWILKRNDHDLCSIQHITHTQFWSIENVRSTNAFKPVRFRVFFSHYTLIVEMYFFFISVCFLLMILIDNWLWIWNHSNAIPRFHRNRSRIWIFAYLQYTFMHIIYYMLIMFLSFHFVWLL